MFIELKADATFQQETILVERLQGMGFVVKQSAFGRLAIVGGVTELVQQNEFEKLPYVEKVCMPTARYMLVSRQYRRESTVIQVKGRDIGGGGLFVVGGPCSIETEEQIHACAMAVQASGAQGLRGGAFKPRTSPYDFQGLAEKGIHLLHDAGKEYGLITVSEITDVSQIPLFVGCIDILQVGARNMQNFHLLRELGKLKVPILLKRGFAATYHDLLMAAEYIVSEGNPNVILCERGIRTFENHTRNTLDLNAVPALKELTHLPVIVDPSHGTGLRSLVAPMAHAAVAAGADGLMIETHPDPSRALSDAQQTISLAAFCRLVQAAGVVHKVIRQFSP